MNSKNNKVRTIRRFLEMSQEEFADMVGVSTSTIAKVESGKMPISEHLRDRMVKKCGVNFGFFDGDEDIHITAMPDKKETTSYRDALVQRLEKEVEDWKTMALRLSSYLQPGKLKDPVHSGVFTMKSTRTRSAALYN